MSRRYGLVFGFLGLAALDTTSHIFFKLAAQSLPPQIGVVPWLAQVATTPQIYVAVACYIATLFVWLTLLRDAPIGPAFAASHLEVLGVLAASMSIFGEQVSPVQWLGAGAIVAGVLCLAYGEQSFISDKKPHG